MKFVTSPPAIRPSARRLRAGRSTRKPDTGEDSDERHRHELPKNQSLSALPVGDESAVDARVLVVRGTDARMERR